MRSTTLAIIHSVSGMTGTDENLRRQVWMQTAELLKPMLGKVCGRFEPAAKAWGQDVDKPYGTILGRCDPALFLYFFATGQEVQSKAVKHHMNAFMCQFDLGEKHQDGEMTGFTLNPKSDAGQEIAVHLQWHLGMMAGEVFPDSGIYVAPARQSVVSEKLSEQILKHIGDYAISVVRICDESGTES